MVAGAQAGAAFGPWGALIGGAMGGASDLGSQALSGANESKANTDARSFYDGSGWTVSTGSSRATGGARSGGPDMSSTGSPSFGNTPAGMPALPAGIDGLGTFSSGGLFSSPWLWLAIAAGAGIFLAKG